MDTGLGVGIASFLVATTAAVIAYRQLRVEGKGLAGSTHPSVWLALVAERHEGRNVAFLRLTNSASEAVAERIHVEVLMAGRADSLSDDYRSVANWSSLGPKVSVNLALPPGSDGRFISVTELALSFSHIDAAWEYSYGANEPVRHGRYMRPLIQLLNDSEMRHE